jgi:hypothetical protein
MKPAKIELSIDELVLHGSSRGDQYTIADAVERELARLLTEGSMPPAFVRNVERARLDAGAFNVAPGSDAKTLGGQVAHAVHAKLSR